jgi:hypothetical protein
MPFHVYSTGTNSTLYREYENRGDGTKIPVVRKQLLIKGGAGLARKQGLLTPLGVKTEVSDSDMEWLNANRSFQRHVESGFIKVMKQNIDPEKAAADMASRDKSAPLVPQDFKDGDEPKTNSEVPVPRFGKGK